MASVKRHLPGGGLYAKSVLPNGLRVVTETIPGARSIAIGVWVDVGSRHEAPEVNGVAHFIEHMVFKGTRHRTARQVADSLEALGGSLNAFTTREHTCYIARVLDEHLEQAVDVLADLTCHPTMTRTNLVREGMVIQEEIKESRDNPADHVHDVLARVFWGEHPLGQPIMGTMETVAGMTRPRMLDFMRRHYRAGSVVIAASGSVSHTRLVRLAKSLFSFPDGEPVPPIRATYLEHPRCEVVSNDSAQVHLCLGFPGVSYTDRLRMAMMVLNTYLGGGMSSVLFQRVREQKGLAYSIYSFHEFYRDGGLFGTYLSTDPERCRQAYDIVLGELRRVRRRRLSDSTLDKIKAQIKGHLTLGLESTGSRMQRLGRMELMMGWYQPLAQTLREIDRVTPTQVLETARLVLDESRMAVAALGPVERSGFC